MKITVLTLFPELIHSVMNTSICGRAIESGLLELRAVNIRDFTENRNKRVDDYTYGGGAGMIMQAQPVFDAYKSLGDKTGVPVIYMTPVGEVFNQTMAERLSQNEELIFLCGHYEGIDQRAVDAIVTQPVSIGDYILTGGELPACVCMDAVVRLLPGVLGNDESTMEESFGQGLLEYPQYSRPRLWQGEEVPSVLLEGNHRKIEAWRKEQSISVTQKYRPDLYERWIASNPDYFAEKEIKKRKRLLEE